MHKQIVVEFTKHQLKELINDENSCVKLRKSNYHLALLPQHLVDIGTSIKDLLNVGVTKYNKKLDGILLSYKNIRVLKSPGVIVTDSFYIHIDIEADFYIFKPDVGCTLTGIVNKKSQDHVGCIVHRVFNISVPSQTDDPNWPGNYVDIGEVVLLKITYINLDASLPYIRASFVSTNKKRKKKKNIRVDNTEDNYISIEKKYPEFNNKATIEKSSNKEKRKKHKHKHEEKYEESNETFEQINDSTENKKSKKHSVEESEINELSEKSLKKKKHKHRKSDNLENIENNKLNEFNAEKKKQKKSSKNTTLSHLNEDSDLHNKTDKSFATNESANITENDTSVAMDAEHLNRKNKKRNRHGKSNNISVETSNTYITNNHSDDETTAKKRKKHKHKTEMSYEIDDYLKSSSSDRRSHNSFPVMADREDRITKIEYVSAAQQNICWNNIDLKFSDTEIERTLQESGKWKSVNSANDSFENTSFSTPSTSKKRKLEEEPEESKKRKRRKMEKEQLKLVSPSSEVFNNTFNRKKHKSMKSK